MYNHNTANEFQSELFPGVNIILRKMTEGRRLELRKLIGEPNRKIRDILREQALLEKEPEETRDVHRWLTLQDEFDGLMLEQINPSWLSWGVKSIEGLEVDGRKLGVEDWKDWPSALFEEVLNAVKSEAELGGTARKNSSSPIMPSGPAQSTPTPSTAGSANGEDTGVSGTASSTLRIV